MDEINMINIEREKVLRRIIKVSGKNGFISKRNLSHGLAYLLDASRLGIILEDLIKEGVILKRKSENNGIVFCTIPPTIEFISLTKPLLDEGVREERLLEGLQVCPCCHGGVYIPVEKYRDYKSLRLEEKGIVEDIKWDEDIESDSVLDILGDRD